MPYTKCKSLLFIVICLFFSCKRIKVVAVNDYSNEDKAKLFEGNEKFQGSCDNIAQNKISLIDGKKSCLVSIKSNINFTKIIGNLNKDVSIIVNQEICPQKIKDNKIIPILFKYKNIGICNLSSNIHMIGKKTFLTPKGIVGLIKPSVFQTSKDIWPDFKKMNLSELGRLIKNEDKPKSGRFPAKKIEIKSEIIPAWDFKDNSRCWYNKGNNLFRALRIAILIDRKYYEIFYGNGKIYEITSRSFTFVDQTDSVFQIYKNGDPVKGDEKLEHVQYSNISMEKNLCTSQISVKVPKNKKSAYSKNRKFIFKPIDPRFGQSVAFYAVASIRDWLNSWFGDLLSNKKFTIYMTDSRENAIFGPYFTDPKFDSRVSHPSIFLPNTMSNRRLIKNGNYLLYRIRDSIEPAMHEFSHYIGFQFMDQNLNSVENLAMHEGLADSITQMKTGDPCLAESICTEYSSNLCSQNMKCLRNANNNYKIGDDFYKSYCRNEGLKKSYHKCSQFISGFFWDLRGLIGVSGVMSNIKSTLTMIPRKNVDFKVFFETLFLADKTYHAGKYYCHLKTISIKRNIYSIIDLSSIYPTEKDYPKC